MYYHRRDAIQVSPRYGGIAAPAAVRPCGALLTRAERQAREEAAGLTAVAASCLDDAAEGLDGPIRDQVGEWADRLAAWSAQYLPDGHTGFAPR